MAGALKIPKKWPGLIEAYRFVKPYVLSNIWKILGITVFFFVIDFILYVILGANNVSTQIILNVALFVLGSLSKPTILKAYYNGFTGSEESAIKILDFGLTHFLKFLLLDILMDIILGALGGLAYLGGYAGHLLASGGLNAFLTAIGAVILGLPLLFVYPRLILSPYFMLLDNLNPLQAITKSFKALNTKERYIQMYSVLLFKLGIYLIALTIIGIPFAIYWSLIASGIFFMLAWMYGASKKMPQPKIPAV